MNKQENEVRQFTRPKREAKKDTKHKITAQAFMDELDKSSDLSEPVDEKAMQDTRTQFQKQRDTNKQI